jgi:hypothetical protein
MIQKAAQPPTQQESPFQPPQPPPYEMSKFQGLQSSTTRAGVKDEQCWWIDGYIPLGEMDLRTLPGVGPVVWTAPTTISFFGFANIGATPIAVVFLNDGSIWQVNTATGAAVNFAPAGTIQNPGKQNTGMSQYGSQYVLIVTKQTNGYFIWNGTTFFKPGDAFGGGTVPTGIGGTSVETYTGRVWISNGPTVFFSAPGAVVDFSSANGGGNFTSNDSFLRVGYTQLIQTNGFLYLIGDSSINYISGVQTSGSPPITTFTNQNADPEVGTPYSATVNVFGRNIVFANAWGVHVSYGAAVTKISDDLDGFYSSVQNFDNQQLSAAKATVFNKKLWMLLAPVIDAFTAQKRNKLLCWNGRFWFVSEQDITLSFVQSQEINSVLTAWGTNGLTLRRLFQAPSTGFTKRVMSKFWIQPIGPEMRKTANRFWAVAQYYSQNNVDVNLFVQSENASSIGGFASKVLVPSPGNLQMNWTTLGGTPMVWTTQGGRQMIWTTTAVGITVFSPASIAQQGVLLGFTLETTAADMAWITTAMADALWSYRG